MNVTAESSLLSPLKPSARVRILSTAHLLFYREGIRATGIDRIIAEAGVTKVTFYRHFPSKNDLILAFLDYRHLLWMTWFQNALQKYGNNVQSIAPALQEWFADPAFRGCAFINTLGEMGDSLPFVAQKTWHHKSELGKVIANLLPENSDRENVARAIVIAMDGAIIRAAWGEPREALQGFNFLIQGIFPYRPE
ncbi:TetR family transcriptional regulator [Acidithiobacillus marinus]|uniref:TetR family transcriptional regulator n=2 Tax=Acidithiobacillus marinus TaxID=187490 RepID=A0A2I1DI95_9PROT|nr:TetR family transcriptional regulator [Acidithiobacillus marinus]